MQKTVIKKLYHSIREVAERTGIEPHVLRFWEKEFPMLRPKRGRSGNRAYRDRDVQVVLAIKRLLYDQKYTIQGAVEQLRDDRALWEDQPLDGRGKGDGPSDPLLLADLRKMLVELRQLID